MKPLCDIEVWVNGGRYSVLSPKTKRCEGSTVGGKTLSSISHGFGHKIKQ